MTTDSAALPTILVPERWRRSSDVERGMLVAARCGRAPRSGYAPQLTFRFEPVHDDLPGWRQRAIDELDAQLTMFALEDSDEYELDGRVLAYRRFAHRIGETDVVCDQWAWLGDAVGYTLTCSCAREDYENYSDLFEVILESVEVSRSS